MNDLRLNLTALRRKRLFESHPEVVRMDDLTDASENAFAFSRRQVLKSAGLAAVALAPGLQTAKAKMTPQVKGPFRMDQDGEVVNFYLGKDLCWSIDPKQFSGSPKLVVDRTPENLRIALKNAYYPGTSIPADFSLNLKPRLVDCLMHLKMKFGGFSTKGVFEEWLAGDNAMQSPVTLSHSEPLNAEEARLQLQGSAHAEFTPDWKIALRGTDIARYTSTKAGLSASEVQLSIPSTTVLSSVSVTPGKRSLISFERGLGEWQVEHGLNPDRDWQLDINSDTFDRFTLEAVETEQGASIHAVVLEQKDLSLKSTFSPLGALGHDGNSFKLPLTGVRFATLMTSADTEHALHARYDETGKWLYGKVASFLIGAAPKAASTNSASPNSASSAQETENFRSFELYARNGILEHLHCEPDILKVMVPMPGALVEPSDVPRGTRLAFTRTPSEPHPYLAQFPLGDKGDDEGEFRFPANFVIGAVRALDLLVLKFEFLNMEFRGSKDGLQLVKTKPKDPQAIQDPYLVVHFPPQNIAEQAYFEASANVVYKPWPPPPAPPKPKDYPPNDPGGSDPIPVNPSVAGSRLSGGSRLVFWVPDGVTTLPYSLTGLLDWSQLVPSLVPVALPPPPPPDSIYLKSPNPYGVAKMTLGNSGGSKVPIFRGSSKINTLPVTSALLTDVTYAPKYTVTIDQGKKQTAISSIQQYTKTPMDSEQVSAIGDLLGQSSSGLHVVQVPGFKIDLTIREPHLWETAIESPYRLFLSPNQFAGWAHSKTPVGVPDPKYGNKINWVELWHTRLGLMSTDAENHPIVDENDEYYRTLRAIWSPDFNPADSNANQYPSHYKSGDPSTAASPFRMSLDARDRHEIVELTSGFTVWGKYDNKTSERFIRADRFMMSSLGSWMNTRGAWDLPNDPDKPVSLEEWRHRATMGRDHYVKVVYAGYMFPFGNAASLIKITERKFEQAPGTKYMTAVLRQRFFIVIRQPTKVYPVAGGFQPNNGNQLPFKSITIKTLVTPNLDKPESFDIDSKGQEAFWPHVAGNDFLFHVSGEDWEGRPIEFAAPMAFIDRTQAWLQTPIDAAIKGYNSGTGSAAHNQIPVKGQKIAYAPNKKSGDTTFETSILHLGAEEPTTFPKSDPQIVSYMKADQPGFFPILQMSEVNVESIKHIAAMTGDIPVAYHPQYISNGFGDAKNAVDAFMNIVKVDGSGKIVQDAVGLAFGGTDPAKATTDKIGGLISPSMGITALSRLSGPVSGSSSGGSVPGTGKSLETLMNGGFDPSSFFGNALGDVKLLGGISLMDILKVLGAADSAFNGGGAGQALDNVKQQLSDTLKDVTEAITPDSSVFSQLLSVLCPVPAFVTQMLNQVAGATQQAQDAANAAVGDGLKIPSQVQIVFRWDPQVDTHGPFVAGPVTPTTFQFTALILVPIKAPDVSGVTNGVPPTAPAIGTPTYSISAKLTNFTIELFDIIKLQFNSVSFKKESGKNAEVHADINDIEFEGALSFINGLEKVIPSDGFGGSGLSVKISPLGVKVGFSLAIPDLEVGCFALTNLSLGAELDLPFTGDPLRFRFNFCSPDNPFALTIYCLGGGGSFGISLGLDGVEEIDASFEFGAEINLDFGVASGGVHIMAGFKFMLQKVGTGDDVKLTGYLRIGGSLSVMAIISVSIELDMSLTYENNNGQKSVYGDATLSFSVSILFFSISFSTSVHKEFDDPALGFKDYLENGEKDWEVMRLAYAWA
jgi:hypothetical protein